MKSWICSETYRAFSMPINRVRSKGNEAALISYRVDITGDILCPTGPIRSNTLTDTKPSFKKEYIAIFCKVQNLGLSKAYPMSLGTLRSSLFHSNTYGQSGVHQDIVRFLIQIWHEMKIRSSFHNLSANA